MLSGTALAHGGLLHRLHTLNSLPNDKNLDWFRLRAFADNKITVNEKLKFGLRRVENIVEKEKMLVTSFFSFSHNVFKRLVLQTPVSKGFFGKG